MSDSQLGPLDKMYRDTNIVILVIFGVCCSGIALILSLVAYFTGKDAKAKQNAMIVAIIGGAIMAVNVIFYFIKFAGAVAAGAVR